MNIEANFQVCSNLIRQSAAEGAELIVTPEYTLRVTLAATMGGILPMNEQFAEESYPILDKYKLLASELNVWLILGSMQVKTIDNPDKIFNRSYMIAPSNNKQTPGNIVAHYDKIHTFQAVFENTSIPPYNESIFTHNGNEAVVVKTPFGIIGMSICFDWRFSHLYRDMAKAGAQFITIPSTCTYTTGEAHWHCLVRARAIETGCYVFAPAQCGVHPSGRSSYGHSLIVDPWGEIIAEGSETDVGYITAIVEPNLVNTARSRIPSLSSDRKYTLKLIDSNINDHIQ